LTLALRKVSGQLYAPATVIHGQQSPHIHWTGGRGGPQTRRKMAKEKISAAGKNWSSAIKPWTQSLKWLKHLSSHLELCHENEWRCKCIDLCSQWITARERDVLPTGLSKIQNWFGHQKQTAKSLCMPGNKIWAQSVT
jgi:hypothetical protein